MTRQEVAKFLGVSEKTVNNYVKAGKIPVSYAPGRTSPVAVFDREQVEKFKESQAPVVIEATVEEGSQENFEPNFETQNEREEGTSNLARVEPSQQNFEDSNLNLRGLVEMVAAVVKEQGRGEVTLLELANRPALTATEVNALYRVPEREVRNAMKDGSLRSSKVGRSQQALKEDIEVWFKARFKS